MKRTEHIKLNVRIIMSLALVIFAIIGIYIVVFGIHYRAYEEKVLGRENIRTLHSLSNSIDSMIQNVDEYSKMLISDRTVQEHMRFGNLFASPSGQSEVIHSIYSISQFSDHIDSIWLVDMRGQKLSVGVNVNVFKTNINDDYKELQKPYGSYRIFHNEEDGSFSLVRSFNSLDNFKSRGLVGVDINRQVFEQLFDDIINPEEEQISVLDREGVVMYQCGNVTDQQQLLADAASLQTEETEKLEQVLIGKKKYMLAGVQSGESGWRILRYTPTERRSMSELVQFNMVMGTVIAVLLLIFAAVLSTLLTVPVQELYSCMAKTEEGVLTKVESIPHLEEFRHLFRGYNNMVDRIDLLIRTTIDRQRRIRQVELNEIQEQMKPHFLYNTLDSIQALAMMGETDKVLRLVETLGDFYRKSVSGGKELLSVSEECRIAQDYADIMRVRFENAFDFYMEIEEQCKTYMLPKLTIQPLVENSFQYAVRARHDYGEIWVRVTMEEQKLHICVEDSGHGIPQNIVEELAQNLEPGKGKSLGLRGTIERLRLMYGESFEYKIENKEKSAVHLYIAVDVEGR